MNKVLIIDESASDGRIMSGLLSKAGYDPVCAENIEAGKLEVTKLPPGVVIVTAMRLHNGTANHQSSRSQKPHIVIEAGGAALVGKHDPTSQHAEMYNRIKGYFKTSAGGTMIVKNIHLLPFDKQSVLLPFAANR